MGKAGHPTPGIDYPRTFQEFDAWFCDEAACRDYIRPERVNDNETAGLQN
jgi:hypothetical protein